LYWFATAELNDDDYHQDEQGKKPRQRNSKADRRAQKAAQQPSPQFDQPDQDQIEPSIASLDAPADGAVALESAPMMTAEVAAPAAASIVAAPTDNDPISIQTIANAYRDYTRKSLQESGSLVENLMGVRSLDKAMEVQTEFARQAYANFVAESQKMWGLYRELAQQAFRPWMGFAAKAAPADR
jgi:hypothetical protein